VGQKASGKAASKLFTAAVERMNIDNITTVGIVFSRAIRRVSLASRFLLFEYSCSEQAEHRFGIVRSS